MAGNSEVRFIKIEGGGGFIATKAVAKAVPVFSRGELMFRLYSASGYRLGRCTFEEWCRVLDASNQTPEETEKSACM